MEQIASWYEQKNKYTVFGPHGKVKLFLAKEKTHCFWRICCGEHRPFKFTVYDHTGEKDKKAMVFKRDFRFCGWAAIPCCAHKVDVHYLVNSKGKALGRENSKTKVANVRVPVCGGGLIPTFYVDDNNGHNLAKITGPFCCVCDTCGSEFNIHDNEGKLIGEIRKLSPKNLKDTALELVTEADRFKLTFPKELSPSTKMALLAATLQIDFQFFEDDRGLLQCRFCDIYCCGWPCACCPKCCCKSRDRKHRFVDQHRKGGPSTDLQTMER